MRLKYMDVVIIGTMRLIDIFTEKWLNEIGVDTGDKVFSTTSPGMSVYSSRNLDIFATPNNLKVVMKNNEGKDNSLKILSGYINASFGISEFKAIGFNFVWETEKIKEIDLRITGVDFKNVFGEESNLSYGAVIYDNREDYRLRVLEEIVRDMKTQDQKYVLNFNFHHWVEGKSKSDVESILRTFDGKQETSKKIAVALSDEKEGKI